MTLEELLEIVRESYMRTHGHAATDEQLVANVVGLIKSGRVELGAAPMKQQGGE